MSKQSNQRYRKEVAKSKKDSVKNGLEKSNFENTSSKEERTHQNNKNS